MAFEQDAKARSPLLLRVRTHMRTFIAYITCTALLCGCVSTAPNNDLGFTKAASLASLNGCYENRGETGQGAGLRLLSGTIWPNVDFEGNQIEAVRVIAIEDNAIRVAAVKAHKIVREDTFVKGKDFTFQSGQITISRAFGSAATKPGNVFIGGAVGATTLGVDAGGNGRSVDSATFAGTVFLVIPIAGSVHDAVRFKRNIDLCISK